MKFINYHSKRFSAFWVWVFKEYLEQNCLSKASSLALTSLFALVPLLIVSISVLSMLPSFRSMQGEVQQFILHNMLPSSGEAINQYLKLFMKNRAGLPITAVVILFFISIMMMRSLEKVLNEIWQVKKERPLSQALLLYWAVLSLSPILVGASLGLSSYLLSWRWLNEGVNDLFGFLQILPFIFNLIAFTFIYQVVPYTKVKLRHALLGGLLMAVMFDFAKKIFAWYALNLPTYEMLYGTLAIIPLFIIWIAISWQLFLLAAIVVRGLSIPASQRSKIHYPGLELALKILKALLAKQKLKEEASLNHLAKSIIGANFSELDSVLKALLKHHYVSVNQEQMYVLSCDLSRETLYALYQNLEYFLTLEIHKNDDLALTKEYVQKQLNQPLMNFVDPKMAKVIASVQT